MLFIVIEQLRTMKLWGQMEYAQFNVFTVMLNKYIKNLSTLSSYKLFQKNPKDPHPFAQVLEGQSHVRTPCGVKMCPRTYQSAEM